MILVTVGTHTSGFERLVRAADALASAFDEHVLIQRGSAGYTPQWAEHFQWADGARMAQLTGAARVVVTHAAAGSILVALQQHKPLVVVPRLRGCGEHFDDHQRELARALHAQGRAVCVDEPSAQTLCAAIALAPQLGGGGPGPGALVMALRRQLALWET